MRSFSVFTALAVCCLCSPPAWSQTPLGAADFAVKAEALIGAYVKDGRFSGSVLVARDGRPILREGFGPANREWAIADAPDTEFRLGSLTKQFTATAILQLAEQGKLKLDDPIGKYYLAAPKTWDKVTLALLLSHRSGIPDYTEISGFFRGPARLDRTPEEIIALTRDKPLEFTPGEKFKYDNSGYILLGYVIEKVSGQTYADYLRDHIFQPLGMAHTGYEVSDDILPHRAAGYVKIKGEWKNASYLSMTLPYAAGSLYSTVDDLLLWDEALYAAKPLHRASLDAMFTDHGEKYGYGFVIDKAGDHRLWWHNGGINGFHTYFGRYPDQRLTIIVLSNFESAPVEKIGLQLARLSFGEPVDPQPKPGQVPHAGTQAALLQLMGELRSGQVNFDEMSAPLANLIRPQLGAIKALFGQAGALKSITFSGVSDTGADIYAAKFENGASEWRIMLDAKGKIILLSLSNG
jgi:CubicO group peptidase (beta-lactamase class C family)